MPLPSGSRIGPYEIIAPLGAGGMGEVYRARDTRLGREVAIKALPADFVRDPERLARFEFEAKTLASLSHPNIASIHGLEEQAGVPHLVLELVEGEPLSARLARGPIAPREALAIGIQIAAAIEAAHERGIIHRDLKPGNVMVTPAGVAKVLDFGLAKADAAMNSGLDLSQSPTMAALPGATAAGVILGTAAYMSPEQARGLPVDRRSDVWSFGCVLFECFAGRPLFEGATTADLLARILEREPDWARLPADTPPRVREVLRRCLRKQADERPRDIRDVRLEMVDLTTGGGREDAARMPSIAVLPFENLSGTDDEYFADGITVEILSALSQLEGLRVAARTSCFAFKGKREDLRAVGDQLDVTSVLEGSVRRAGSRLRITVQLVNVADGYQLWSERYDREMTDVFELQDEIARTIATRLRVTLDSEATRNRGRAGTRNLEAYELMLRGRAHANRRGRFLPLAIQCYERAIALDPDYAEALGLLADSYRLMATFGNVPFAGATAKAKRLAEQAIAADPGLAEPWATLACVAEQYEWDFDGAKTYWLKALTLDPRHARARAQGALWGAMRGSMPDAQALAETKRAMDDDPLNAWVVAMYSYMLGITGECDASLAEAERAIDLDPDSFFPQWNLIRAHAWRGDHARALALAPSVLAECGRHHWMLGLVAWTHGEAGHAELARAVYDELEGRSRHEFTPPFWLATSASAAGLDDVALDWVRRAVA
ncbi:MAG: protein kinase, partial [Candidatus Eisenbacteria bacterium]